ncbi:serine/threonine-protein kinase [Streptomyces massasporeus]
MICAADGPKVIDFGIARAFDGTVLTAAGMAVGTLGFMAPEQLDGTGAVGPASDVFSLGVLLCWAATGRGPFDDAEAAAVIARIAEGHADLRLVPDDLRELVRACLAVAPNARPTTDALVRALDPRTAGERPGALFARSEEPFPWPAGVRELIGAYEAKKREVVASAPLVPAAPSTAVPVPAPPDGPSRRRRTRMRVAVAAVAAVLTVTAALVGVRLLARDDGDGRGTGARMIRGCRADVELQVVAACDDDHGDVPRRGAGEERRGMGPLLVGDPALVARAPFGARDGEQRHRLGAALGAEPGQGIGEAPARPATRLPAGSDGQMVPVELLRGDRVCAVPRLSDLLPPARIPHLLL